SISSCSVASLALLLHLHSFPTRRSSDLERSEIAASINGVPQHNVGSRTDVMDACPKAEGMMMMIRSMSPEVLVVDEIGSVEDVRSEEHTSELQSRFDLVCRLLLEKNNQD